MIQPEDEEKKMKHYKKIRGGLIIGILLMLALFYYTVFTK